jgi:hypothetical protein
MYFMTELGGRKRAPRGCVRRKKGNFITISFLLRQHNKYHHFSIIVCRLLAVLRRIRTLSERAEHTFKAIIEFDDNVTSPPRLDFLRLLTHNLSSRSLSLGTRKAREGFENHSHTA